jgi:hypothetical protein
MQEGLKRRGVALENEEYLRALHEATPHQDPSDARTGVQTSVKYVMETQLLIKECYKLLVCFGC